MLNYWLNPHRFGVASQFPRLSRFIFHTSRSQLSSGHVHTLSPSVQQRYQRIPKTYADKFIAKTPKLLMVIYITIPIIEDPWVQRCTALKLGTLTTQVDHSIHFRGPGQWKAFGKVQSSKLWHHKNCKPCLWMMDLEVKAPSQRKNYEKLILQAVSMSTESARFNKVFNESLQVFSSRTGTRTLTVVRFLSLRAALH